MNNFVRIPVAILTSFLAFGAFAQTPAPGPSPRLALGADAQEDVMVTVYNNNYGLVREVRKVTLPAGEVELEFQGVAEKIDATSVAFKSLTAPGDISILEQDYRYDLLSPNTLLEKFVGKKVIYTNYLMKNQSQEMESREGTLLSLHEGAIVQFGDAIEINPPGSVRLPSVPKELLSKPTLIWLLRNNQTSEQKIETSYLTNDMNWKADYVAKVNADDTKVDLTGWVTLDNKSGAAYKNAQLKLVAGSVQRLPEAPAPMPMMARKAAAMGGMQENDAFAEKSFFEYHLYTLGRRTTLANNETKQMTLLEGSGIAVKKTYVLESPAILYRGPQWNEKRKLSVVIELENKKENNLGIALPMGKVRVYKADTDGSLQLIGEDQIDHTPKDEKLRLKLGEAFDITAEGIQTDFKKITDRSSDASFKVTVHNHKEEPIVATIIEHMQGDWNITKETSPHTKRDSQTAEFALPVKPNSDSVLVYTVHFEL